MPTAVRSHAKINLGLHLGAPRVDGFHSLVTVYQTLEIFDVVTVTARPAASTSLSLTSNDGRVPTDSRNTAWKMVELALQLFGLSAQVEIHIEKRLPVQGGLGAGSANAVAALIGLEHELGIDAGSFLPQRMELAAQVGSDVPLFLIGGTVLGTDRGQQVYPLPDIEATWCVVAIPAVGVSTVQAFRDLDALTAGAGLTAAASQAKLNELSRAYASAFSGEVLRTGPEAEGRQEAGSSGVLSVGENLAGTQVSALVRTGISSWLINDFERVVFPQHPSLAEIERTLAADGTPEAAIFSSLSGSGSALYGLFHNRGHAEAAVERLRRADIASRLTRTLSRARYWSEMLLQEES